MSVLSEKILDLTNMCVRLDQVTLKQQQFNIGNDVCMRNKTLALD